MKKTPAKTVKSTRWIFGEPSSFLSGVLVGYTVVTFLLILAYGIVQITAQFLVAR